MKNNNTIQNGDAMSGNEPTGARRRPAEQLEGGTRQRILVSPPIHPLTLNLLRC